MHKRKRRFTRDVLLVLAVLTTAVVVPVAYLATQARRDISEQFIDNVANQAVSGFRAMSLSMEATLGLIHDWGGGGRISIEKGDELAHLLLPVFDRERLLHGVTVAVRDGNSFYLYRTETGFRSRRVALGVEGDNADVVEWSSGHEPVTRSKARSDFDPLNRPWFGPALASGKIHWTEPYTFFTARKVGITASTSFVRKEGNERVVVAFDVLLDEPFAEFYNLAPSENSRVIIFRHDNQLYIPGSGGLQSGFLPMGKVEDNLVRKVHSNWTGEDNLADRVVSIFHDGIVWWCGFRPLDPGNPNTWICVMIPESDILGHAGRRRINLLMLGIGSILGAVALAFWIVRRGRRPFEGAASYFDTEHPEASVRSLIAGGENRAVEFKSTMRMNLHSKKPGKEIELAWLKGVAGFLNTDGGILLLGVTDDGEITGLERDVFENEDKCRLHFKNLIGKHIGADLSKYIRFILVPVDGTTVGVVRCARSGEPVFLKDGNKEHFALNPDFRTTGLSGTCGLSMIQKDAWKWEENEEHSRTSLRPRWRLMPSRA
ncbi:hypothetical protein PDESU_03250 [Pontiella desulfatans]|uniref:Schlafen AlbA-2 domain-containing protein n=1 Tax=Pontiella desulfatans TaxID=2750659 RepID=A0A6C2U3T4_PONDE|nr:RNA-binding domain-containing protein [Pontiella desulfatans]VGO14682.1 hypothetical protein PDESU_03250 [Pontiella desulfatans]